MALRAVELEYEDPFLRKRVRITAPGDEFVEQFLGRPERLSDRSASQGTNVQATQKLIRGGQGPCRFELPEDGGRGLDKGRRGP